MAIMSNRSAVKLLLLAVINVQLILFLLIFLLFNFCRKLVSLVNEISSEID